MASSLTVALAGATGSLGQPVLKELLAAGFKVVVLSRKDSKSTDSLPAHENQTIKKVDFQDSKNLAAALQGVDVVVSTLGSNSINEQRPLVDAAFEAGVKRFLPSEFGSDTENPKNAKLPVFAGKIAVAGLLEEKAKENPNFTYTFFMNNAFFDWGLKYKFLLDVPDRKATLYNGGDRPFSTTTLATVGKGVVGVLRNLDATKNRAVYIHDTVITQNKMIAIAEAADGKKWTTTEQNVDEVVKEAYDELKKPNPNYMSAMIGFLMEAIFQNPADFTDKLDNELLGLPVMNEQQVENVVKAAL